MTQMQALLLSMLSEAAVAAALVAWLRWGAPARAAGAAVLATLLTHWAVWLLMPRLYGPLGYWGAFALAEAAVVLAEAAVYRLIAVRGAGRALLVSLAANAASAGLGLVIYALR